MTHLKKYWWAYVLGLIVLIYVFKNWSSWFGESSSSDATKRGKKCVCQDGREYPGIPANSPRCIKGCEGAL